MPGLLDYIPSQSDVQRTLADLLAGPRNRLADLMPRGLLGAARQYISDAAPGGALNREWTPENVRTAGEVASMMPNPAGDVISGLLAVDDLRKGDYGSAALNGLGLVPFVPAMGGILKRADLKRGGPEFGQWELDRVERRLRPEEYVDATGQERIKYVADMENAEQSWGSGQPVANIYWMKDKRTGDVKPFGDDTAHYAMGSDTSSFAKSKFAEQLSKQRNDWFKAQKEAMGMKWHEGGPAFERVREMLLLDKINEQRAIELMQKYAPKK